MSMRRSTCSDSQKPEPIWVGTWPTATGEAITGRVNFAAYELLLWTRLVRGGQ